MSATWIQREATFDVYVNAARVMYNGLTISQGLDQITTVATFDLVDQPTIPVAGDPVRIDWVNTASGRATVQFAGRVYAVDTEGYPHRVGIIAQGPLGVLSTCIRQPGDGDLNLTGLTDGAAVEAVLTYCGVAFTPADIADAGYELGEREPVYWHEDGQATAATITDEIDRVFFSKLMDIGNSRVIRGFYDLASVATSGIRNYVRGADSRLFANRKAAGEITRIQNVWKVRGVSIDCGGAEAGCTCQPHAAADADNAILDAWTGVLGARAATAFFDSDLIQDESLANHVVTRLMEWFNRTPIELATEVQSEPQLYPCRIVSVRDNTYGIDLPSATAFTISRVEVRPESTNLTLIGGPPGDVGTVTSSVEELCNDSEDVQDWPGDFVDPGFSDFPDLGDGVFTPFPDDGWLDFPAPEVPDVTSPFISCTEDGYGICPPDFTGTCHESNTDGSSCIGSPPPTPCREPGWRPKDYVDSDELLTFSCDCTVHANLRVAGGSSPSLHYYVEADGTADKVTACRFISEGASAQVTVGISTLTDPLVTDGAVDLQPGGDVCFGFDFKFCNAGESITLFFLGTDGAGNDTAGLDHTLTLYATPGQHFAQSFGPGYEASSSAFSAPADGVLHEGTAERHHSFGIDDRDNGSQSVGAGLPLNTVLHATLCLETSGDDPRLLWDNGQDADYAQHLNYIDEDNPSPGEPTHGEEPATHVAHAIHVRLTPNGGQCDDEDCPGPTVWGLTAGHSTCADNPDYDPTAGDDDA